MWARKQALTCVADYYAPPIRLGIPFLSLRIFLKIEASFRSANGIRWARLRSGSGVPFFNDQARNHIADLENDSILK